MSFKASAPGSMMLLGEYAVLHGKQALVCAVDKRITVTLTPREDTRIEIHSSIHGHYATEIAELSIERPFHFVLGALRQNQSKLKRGCHIDITSEFSDKIGLGSSAAVTVATLAVLANWLNLKVSLPELVRQGRNLVRQIQGVGSGADIAASVYGGIVGYSTQPLVVEKHAITHPITALYAGYKTPTVDAIKKVHNYFSAYPVLYRHICNSIGQCAVEASRLVRMGEWKKIGEIMNTQQGMMESLGVSSSHLRNLVDNLRNQPGILGAKISGSGMGDCVIGLGELPDDYVCTASQQGVELIPVKMTLQGVYCEKI
jgi:mevalonate kinase